MAIRDKVAAIDVVTETDLSPDAIGEAGRRSLEAGRRLLNSTMSESAAGAAAQDYVIKGPAACEPDGHEGVVGRARGRPQADAVRGRRPSHEPVHRYVHPDRATTAPGRSWARRSAETLRQELGARVDAVSGHGCGRLHRAVVVPLIGRTGTTSDTPCPVRGSSSRAGPRPASRSRAHAGWPSPAEDRGVIQRASRHSARWTGPGGMSGCGSSRLTAPFATVDHEHRPFQERLEHF